MDSLQNFVYSFGLNYNKIDRNNLNYSNVQIDALRNTNKSIRYINQDKILKQNLAMQKTHSLEDSSRSNNNNISMSSLKSNRNLVSVPHTIDNKRMRNMFTLNQIEILEKVFESTHYPDSSIREHLSSRLNLSVLRIQVWFQNRRAKFRKMDVLKQSKKSNFCKISRNLSESTKNDDRVVSSTSNIDLHQHVSQLSKNTYSSVFNGLRNQQNTNQTYSYNFDTNQALQFTTTNYSRLLQENTAFNFAPNSYNIPINFKKLTLDMNNSENNYIQELNLIDHFQQYDHYHFNPLPTTIPITEKFYYE